MPAEAWGALASVLVALIGLAGLMYKEIRSQGKVARNTAEMIDGTNGSSIGQMVERIDQRFEEFRVSTEEGQASVLAHIADLQKRMSVYSGELLTLSRKLDNHMADEMGDTGSYATTLHAINDLRTDMLQVTGRIQEAMKFMDAYEGSRLWDATEVNRWIGKIEELDDKVTDIKDRVHDLEHRVE